MDLWESRKVFSANLTAIEHYLGPILARCCLPAFPYVVDPLLIYKASWVTARRALLIGPVDRLISLEK